MSQLAESILSAARALPEGELVGAKEFLHLGTRAAVDQTLSRLAKAGRLIRVGRGLYGVPVTTRFGVRPPSTEAVLQAIQEATGEVIVPAGAAEANALGLTTQVPVREIFLTSGKSRVLRLGKRTVQLTRGPSWQLQYRRSRAGQALRALAWAGPRHAQVTVSKLRDVLSPAEWTQVERSRRNAPPWVAKAVSPSPNR